MRGAEICLTPAEFDALVRFVPGHDLSVRLRDRGEGYTEVELLDAEGNVTKSVALHPVYAPKAPRWLRKRDVGETPMEDGPSTTSDTSGTRTWPKSPSTWT